MAIKIESKITGYEVAGGKNDKSQQIAEVTETNIVHMHEKLERPDELVGNTYKIKTPLTEHALYVTVNDIILNEGTEHEKRRPFEIFINSKSMEHFQWIVALTRIISAVFRKGGDVTFLVEELRSVFDPRGGYFKKGRYIPSLVAELGDVIECHMKHIGLIVTEEDAHQKKFIEQKRAEIEAKTKKQPQPEESSNDFPPEAQLCNKCMTKAVMKMDGCMTCLNCGDSKCG
ncbi:MAG: NrdJb [Gammaproteobacteria bacterium]|nr:NrdJb [Gammaproteobacteria bacterium]